MQRSPLCRLGSMLGVSTLLVTTSCGDGVLGGSSHMTGGGGSSSDVTSGTGPATGPDTGPTTGPGSGPGPGAGGSAGGGGPTGTGGSGMPPVDGCNPVLPGTFTVNCSGCHTLNGQANTRYPDLYKFQGMLADFTM